MTVEKTRIRQDTDYRPSSPEMPSRRYLIDTGDYRWEVYVWRCRIRETGTTVYRGVAEDMHSAYGLTANEVVNDLAAIMRLKVAAFSGRDKTMSLADVKDYLDPADAAREGIKLADALSRKPFFARLFGL